MRKAKLPNRRVFVDSGVSPDNEEQIFITFSSLIGKNRVIELKSHQRPPCKFRIIKDKILVTQLLLSKEAAIELARLINEEYGIS